MSRQTPTGTFRQAIDLTLAIGARGEPMQHDEEDKGMQHVQQHLNALPGFGLYL